MRGLSIRWISAVAALVASAVLLNTGAANAQAANANLAEFMRLAAAGKDALARVESFPNDGQVHVPIGTRVTYRTDPPTSGNHWERWVDPGRYSEVPPNEMLVHSLEHGHIVIYIERPTAEAVRLLTLWSNIWRGSWDGIVVVPRPGLGSGVILTAWTKMLRQDAFDAAGAAAFIEAYRGRGPENPMR
jgi:hypothetical protein